MQQNYCHSYLWLIIRIINYANDLWLCVDVYVKYKFRVSMHQVIINCSNYSPQMLFRVSCFVLQSDAKAVIPFYQSLIELMGKFSILLTNGSLQRKIHDLIGSFFKSPHLEDQITRDAKLFSTING